MQEHIKGEKEMASKITEFFREYVLGFSIASTIASVFLILMGVIWFFANDLTLGRYTDLINSLGGWNGYLLVIGLILLFIGTWYLYSYNKNRKFILEEFETNKRSELLKKHNELKNITKHMPTKYRDMLKNKEEELKIK